MEETNQAAAVAAGPSDTGHVLSRRGGKRGPRPRINRDPQATREPVRAEPIRQRVRMRRGGQAKDKFAIPSHLMQDGTSYEWKRASVYGKPDSGNIIEMREQGWEAVDDPVLRAYFMPEGHTGAIERDGLVLMERPQALTDEAREDDRLAARLAVSVKEQQINSAPDGQFERSNKGSPLGSVKHAYGPGEVPVD